MKVMHVVIELRVKLAEKFREISYSERKNFRHFDFLRAFHAHDMYSRHRIIKPTS